MKTQRTLAILAAALVTGLATSAAQADYKKCWTRSDGAVVCDYYQRVSSGRKLKPKLDVGSRKAEEFETGSSDWWKAMDRDGRGGFRR
jgi:hypothetical protein